jgi:adenylyltransferase/sulfurtransferase
MSTEKLYERYQRQILLKEFGIAGQQKLLQAKVLVIGSGGLGCPVLQYLTAAGIGCIGIVDNDVVSITNLHRQILFNTNDIGKAKVSVAAQKLRLVNPDTELIEYPIHLDKNNCLEIINEYDVIIDCTDNFASRYMINDACVLKGKPLIYGAVNRFEGQVAVFNVTGNEKKRTANYRDLFPVQPEQTEVLNCAEAGVLGVLPGVIGSMQASEAIKLITGIGEILSNQLLTYNALNNQFFIFKYEPSSKPGISLRNETEFLKMNYDDACITDNFNFEIDADKFDSLSLQGKTKVIDVREFNELPAVTEFEHERIPMSELKNNLNELAADTIIFFCQTGIRSLKAAAMANELFENKKRCYSLQGGILSWKKIHEKQLI